MLHFGHSWEGLNVTLEVKISEPLKSIQTFPQFNHFKKFRARQQKKITILLRNEAFVTHFSLESSLNASHQHS